MDNEPKCTLTIYFKDEFRNHVVYKFETENIKRQLDNNKSYINFSETSGTEFIYNMGYVKYFRWSN